MALAGCPVQSVWFPLCVFSIASLVAFSFVVLRSFGAQRAIAGSLGLAAMGGEIYALQLRGDFGHATSWIAGGLALFLIFFEERHIALMAFMALPRGILNQHVLVEFGAFAGLVAGGIGLTFRFPDIPPSRFFPWRSWCSPITSFRSGCR